MPDITPDDAGHDDGHHGHRQSTGILTTNDHAAALAPLLERAADLAERQVRDAHDEARRARRHGRVAWAVAVVLVGAAAGVAVHARENALRAAADRDAVRDRLNTETAERASYGSTTEAELAELRRQLLDARTAAAVAENEAHHLRAELMTRTISDTPTPTPIGTPYSLIRID